MGPAQIGPIELAVAHEYSGIFESVRQWVGAVERYLVGGPRLRSEVDLRRLGTGSPSGPDEHPR
jgi:hypothetical protein